jgi:hypothetical protein
MEDKKPQEFTPSYAADVKQRFETLEQSVEELIAFTKRLGHVPSAKKSA